VLVPVAAVTAVVTLAVVSRPASADEVGDLRSQARALSQKMVQEQLQVDADQQLYSVATRKLHADDSALAAVTQLLGRDARLVAQDTATVRDLAVRSYMSGGDALSGAELSAFTGSGETDQVVSEYSEIAAANLESSLDQLHAAQLALQDQQVALHHAQLVARGDQTDRAGALGQAQGTEAQLTSLHSLVTGQLAAAVSAEQSAQDAAAAHAAGTANLAPPVPGGAPPTVADPALPPYLQCVVEAESGGDYGAVSPSGTYMGAFQFSQSTWNGAAAAAGLSFLVGVPPDKATKAEQDAVAVALYALDGHQPWLGDRCG